MFAELAKHDLARLRESGYEVTDEEVIALNDLAVQIENGKDSTVANHPRIAYAGNVILHEPTIAAEIWWNQYGIDAAWTSKGQLRTHFFMLAHARDAELLNALVKPSDIRKAVNAWLRGLGATDAELLRAMLYVKHGLNWMLPDETPEEPNPQKRLDTLNHLLCIAAGTTGISPDELKTQTQTQLMQMLSATRLANNLKPSIAKLYIRYQQTIRKIEERGKPHGGD